MFKINPGSDLSQATCNEHRVKVLEFVYILQELTIKPDGLALLTSMSADIIEALIRLPTAAVRPVTASGRPCILL